MSPHGRSRLKSWVVTLTPILLGLMAMRNSNTARSENHITAGAVATMQQDANQDAATLDAALAKIGKLETRVKVLEKQRSVGSATRKRVGDEVEPSASRPDRGPGLLGLAAAAGKGVWHFIFGGG